MCVPHSDFTAFGFLGEFYSCACVCVCVSRTHREQEKAAARREEELLKRLNDEKEVAMRNAEGVSREQVVRVCM